MENYFNYFTEIEHCFQRCRAQYWHDAPMLLSTLDWAVIESWKEAGIPLAAVLAGVERAFEKFSKRRPRYRKVNALGYCSQAVFEVAERMSTDQAQSGTRPAGAADTEAPFRLERVMAYLQANAAALEQAASQVEKNGQRSLAEDLESAARTLRVLAEQESVKAEADSQDLERMLAALEDKISAALTRAASVELLAQFHAEVERGLAGTRSRMTPPQFESLERQFLKNRLYEQYRVPRLSLFYI